MDATQTPSPDRVIALCQALVRTGSLSGEEAAVADIVEARARALDYDEVLRDELGSVIAVRRGQGSGPTVLMDAHMDTVPVTEPERWTRPPLSGEIVAGRLWGRGATDVKGSLAALLVAVGELPAGALDGTVVVSASVAEERMEGAALGRVLDLHPADRVVICEPTDLALGLGHKGRASLVVETAGVPAHTSCPQQGVNAVYRMVEAVPRLRRVALPRDEILGQGVMELVEISSAPFPGSSMVPYRCTARFDRRLVRGETAESVLGQTRAAVADLEGVSVRLHRSRLTCYTGSQLAEEVFHPCWVLPEDSDTAQLARRALREAGQKGRFFHAPYCTNGSCSGGEREIPTVIYGCSHIRDAHVVDEGLDVGQLLQARGGLLRVPRRDQAAQAQPGQGRGPGHGSRRSCRGGRGGGRRVIDRFAPGLTQGG